MAHSNKQLQEAQAKKDRVREYLTAHPAATAAETARALGYGETTVRRAIRENPELKKPLGDREVSFTFREAPTLEQLIKKCKVDLNVDEIEHHVINFYEQGSKHPETGEVTVTPLWQMKVWLKRKKLVDEAIVVRQTIEWVRNNSPVDKRAVVLSTANLKAEDDILLEVAIPDLHLGKLTWAAESGEDYDIKITAGLHQEAVEALYHRSSIFPIKKVLLITGHDFFNSNSAANTTAGGTPQQEDGRWPKTFRVGVETIRKAVEFYRSRVPEVEVQFTAGNHDRERCFYLGEVIAAMYDKCPGVTITNSPKLRNYFRWGKVLIGVAHGDGAKADKLPLIMAGEARALWGDAEHCEIHIGHLHHKRETMFHIGTEQNSVRVRVIPSLTTADIWHSLHGFVGQRRAAEAFLWGKKQGYIGQFSWSPKS